MPTGGDDTANLQAALDGCGSGCTIQLGAGTFHTAQVIARNFRGALLGRGRGVTVLEALPELPVNGAEPWPWSADPTPSAPWPVLLMFLDGRFIVSDLTVRIPSSPSTQPWKIFGGTLSELIAVQVTGDRADAAFDRVDVEGAVGSFLGYNIIFGIAYEGILNNPGEDPTIAPQRPMTGSFSESRCSIRSARYGTMLFNLRDARAVVTKSLVDHADVGYFAQESSGTDVQITENTARNVLDMAAGWSQGFIPEYDGPSHFLIARNRFSIVEGGSVDSDGVTLRDVGATKTLRAEVVDNDIVLQPATPAGPVPLRSGILGNGIRGAMVRGNRIKGPAATGILFDGASENKVFENEVRRAAKWGIAVVTGSSGNAIRGNEVEGSGLFDLLWDGTGTGNVWDDNECRTSDPPGLCSVDDE
jgi:parallel beta-helix repeat protein